MATSNKPKSFWRTIGMRFWVLVVVLLVLNYITVSIFAPGREESVTIPYQPDFVGQVEADNVTKISTTGTTVSGEFKKEFKPSTDKDAKAAKNFETEIPTFADNDALSALLEEHNVTIEAEPVNQGRGFLLNLILGFGPVILLVALFVWISRRAAGGQMNALGSFGRSRARRIEGAQTNITFKDVAGIDESKQELTEVVDFLKNPDRYRKLGGRIPRGVLLAGRPGTGKTLLARAVAGEAGAPFFSVSASEFVEAIVGIGASGSETSSGRPRRPSPRSSSSTSWTRSADREAPARPASAATTSASRRSTRSSRRWTASSPAPP